MRLGKAEEPHGAKLIHRPLMNRRPSLSPAAQNQIEAALRDVLVPLVLAREAQFESGSAAATLNASQVAGTDCTEEQQDPSLPAAAVIQAPGNEAQDVDMVPATAGADDPTDTPMADATAVADVDPTASTSRRPAPQSKRARKRADAEARTASRTAEATRVSVSTHKISLRSGKTVHIPDGIISAEFQTPSHLIGKGKMRAAHQDRPEICSALCLGINAVTRELELEVQNCRRRLAGLAPLQGKADARANQLRMYIPAPSLTSRKQRRDLRDKLHPETARGRWKRTRCGRAKPAEAPRMPEALVGIPRNDPALVHTLREALEASDLLPDVRRLLQDMLVQVEGGEAPLQTGDGTSTAVAKQVQQDTVAIPSPILERMLRLPETQGGLSAGTRSILIALLMAHDPHWFSLLNLVERAQQMGASPLPPTSIWGNCDDNAAMSEKKQRTKASAPLRPASAEEASETGSGIRRNIRIIFVAKEDINPLEIVQHILTTVAARNSANVALRRESANAFKKEQPTALIPTQVDEAGAPSAGLAGTSQAEAPAAAQEEIEDVHIVPMGKNFEHRLCELLAVRRAAVLAITVSMPGSDIPAQVTQADVCGRTLCYCRTRPRPALTLSSGSSSTTSPPPSQQAGSYPLCRSAPVAHRYRRPSTTLLACTSRFESSSCWLMYRSTRRPHVQPRRHCEKRAG